MGNVSSAKTFKVETLWERGFPQENKDGVFKNFAL